VAREDRFGLRFRFKTEDAIGRCIFQKGVYEAPLTRFLLQDLRLRPGDVVIDAGANIGWFSLLLDRVAPDGVTIYAFEPEPLNFGLLCENVARNGATKVVPVRLALGERAGPAVLHLYPHKNRGRHTFTGDPGEAGTVKVEVTTLEAFWRERELDDRPLALLKVDVEGWEQRVVEGAGELLDRCRAVATEVVPSLLRGAGGCPAGLLDRLAARGFVPHLPGPEGVESLDPETVRSRERPLNLVWLPESG